nr:hypothetical protein [Klebsiella pneumoniae subsp. pneumoniae]
MQERALPAQQDGEADDGNGMSRAVAHRDIRRLVRRNGALNVCTAPKSSRMRQLTSRAQASPGREYSSRL